MLNRVFQIMSYTEKGSVVKMNFQQLWADKKIIITEKRPRKKS